MKRFLCFLALAGLVLSAVPTVTSAAPVERKIVVFKEDVLNEGERDALVKKFGGVKLKDLKLAHGKAVLLPANATALLAKDKNVLRIDDDVVVEALDKDEARDGVQDSGRSGALGKNSTSQPAQKLPWGIARVNAPLVWPVTTADPIKVAVIDTGIDVKHPDLLGNLKGGVSTVSYTSSFNDDNGHGTHVAGTIGAANNSVGVVGVGPQIDLYAVKVLDRRGSGYLSDIIEGLDWAAANGIQVVNMSLGTSSNVQSFRDAVIRAKAAGITLVAAAGNSGGAVGYPAAYPEVIAVSATDANNNIASWSSRGAEVDLAAPGVNIFSTYKGQTYATLSGTSMASPHVAGVVALVLSVPEKCNTDGIPGCSPDEVQARLQATATPLGNANLYGAGLVNALTAVQ